MQGLQHNIVSQLQVGWFNIAWVQRSCKPVCRFALVGGPARQDAPKAVDALKKLNVPYMLSLPLVFQTTEEWMASELGVHPVQVALQVGCSPHFLHHPALKACDAINVLPPCCAKRCCSGLSGPPSFLRYTNTFGMTRVGLEAPCKCRVTLVVLHVILCLVHDSIDTKLIIVSVQCLSVYRWRYLSWMEALSPLSLPGGTATPARATRYQTVSTACAAEPSSGLSKHSCHVPLSSWALLTLLP